MAFKVLITANAEADLDSIHDYILKHFLSLQAAENTMTNIKFSIAQVAETPSLGIDVSERVGRQFSDKYPLRMTIAGNYLVFYIVDQTNLIVLRLLYQKQDWISLFK